MQPHLMGRMCTEGLSGWSRILEACVKLCDHEEIGVLLHLRYRQEATAKSGCYVTVGTFA